MKENSDFYFFVGKAKYIPPSFCEELFDVIFSLLPSDRSGVP